MKIVPLQIGTIKNIIMRHSTYMYSLFLTVDSIRIASEQRETERKKRLWLEEEKAMALAKKRFKIEATQVSLGEREEISRETMAAQMLGYRNEILQQQMGRSHPTSTGMQLPRVREPQGGFSTIPEKTMDREVYRRRQAAGGGIRSGSTEFLERNWNLSVSTLFWHT
jgi:CDK-activating kinase assembly factor MAT1